MHWKVVALETGCTVDEQVPLSKLTTFRVGGPADYVVTAPIAAIPTMMTTLRNEQMPIYLLGNGSNILASDDGFRGVVLRIKSDNDDLRIEGDRLYAQAGATLKAMCLFARDNGLSGIETLYGIPGTVGGAVYMNAGAYGGEIADTLKEVTILNTKGQVQTLSATEAALSYRHSRFMETGEVILSAVFQLTSDNSTSIAERMDTCMQARRDKQPLEFPNAGSFFKRPVGHFAGALIDRCGLRGHAVGDAQISEKHAGFVINRGHATCRDILTLSNEVAQRVYQQTGVQLEREVQMMGDMV